ncbi:nitric-oxide synthase, bacterial [Cytobacillus horneckiae]|uniref:nitric oxide synthase oxygenase n=1 Tax=Cytobacillus horneckiae TaxID=549687 RepID=UPI0023EB40A3|nr:nitric oxide synthase oxygenase [Cytobacillus horneckiae]
MSIELMREAEEFIKNGYSELGKSEQETANRIAVVLKMISEKGYYTHTNEEIDYGAKVAWRNSNRCIGRFFWQTLNIIDKRNIQSVEEMAAALFEHIEFATNGGKIRPTITVFPQSRSNSAFRIWNHQLIRYAGYETEEGVIGDTSSIQFTKECIKLGWEPKYGNFDILPLVIQYNQEEPKVFDIPQQLIAEVHLEHPEYEWFKELALKWYAVPLISDMKMEIGGITYPAAPFNGWYMGTEIGARNLADEERYDQLPIIAEMMGLNVKSHASLWKDRALVELNAAVLYSFKNQGVSIVDHHTAAQQFKQFELKEKDKGREVTGDWTWLIPPMSPAATHIFHQPYKNKIKKPNYFYQKKPY